MGLFNNVSDPFQMTNLIDALLPLDEFIIQFGLKEGWNKSQRHIGYPEVE